MLNTNYSNFKKDNRLTIWFWFFILLAGIILAFGFGYFFGRYEQIQINKSLLKIIPDINCGTRQH